MTVAAAYTALTPQVVHAQTLVDALTAAYYNNPTLLARRAQLRATDEEVPQALSNWRPDVSMSVDGGYASSVNTNSIGSGRNQTRQQQSAGLDITQPLFRGGRTLAATSEAENTVRAERARLMATEQTVLLDVISAYMDVFREEAVLNLNLNNEQVLKRQLEATRDRFEVGEITRTDVHQAEARLARTTADRVQSEGDLESARAEYRNVVGEAAPVDLQVPALPSALPATKDEALKLAATKNPSVISSEFDRRAAVDSADGVWGELLPDVELTAGYSRAFEGAAEQGSITTADIGIGINIPIYQQGTVYSRLREARQTSARQAYVIDEQRRSAVSSAAKAWEALITAQARVAAFSTQIDANIVALEGVEREASVGSRTVLDVLDAEQELLDSRVSHVRAQRDEVVAIYELKSSMGQLTARDLELPVTLYDPREHYLEVKGKWFGGRSGGDAQ
ncbi:MAG: TolC family outer membrane protein [Rhodospirillales bacterium]|nr:TolC family outer membrane protein [Rhodospirillales bacterium]